MSRIFDMPYLMRDLDNGLRVIVIRTDYPDIVSLQIPVQTGSRNEVEPGKTGFAHFFEQSVDQLMTYFPNRKDPNLLMIYARLTDRKHAADVEAAINDTLAQSRTALIEAQRLEDTKSPSPSRSVSRLTCGAATRTGLHCGSRALTSASTAVPMHTCFSASGKSAA